MLVKEGELLDFFPGAFGEEDLELLVHGGVKEQNAGAAEKTELKGELIGDERVADELDSESGAEEVEPVGGAIEKLPEEIEESGEPASLHGGGRADKEEIGGDCDEEGADFPRAGEKEAESKRAEGDEDPKVEAGNG